MSQPFMGQINMMGFAFAPRLWAFCNGQLMAVSQNQALFSLLGTTYGGDGMSTFALPNLQSCSPAGAGTSVDPIWQPEAYPQGLIAGVETVTLQPTNIPKHTHNLMATATAAVDGDPNDGELIGTTKLPIFADSKTVVPLGGGPLGTPTSTPHANMQPFLVVNMCISLAGAYPSKN